MRNPGFPAAFKVRSTGMRSALAKLSELIEALQMAEQQV